MDIRDWPMDRIMQLPDNVFGRRWPVLMQANLTDGNPVFDLAEIGLPNRFVIWELMGFNQGSFGVTVEIALALGSQLPASDAEFLVLEKVFPSFIDTTGIRGSIENMTTTGMSLTQLRQGVDAGGRALIGRFKRKAALSLSAWCSVVISSIPNEVPDIYGSRASEQLDELIRLAKRGM